MKQKGETREEGQQMEPAQESSCDFVCGEMKVHIRFTEDGPGLDEILKNYFISVKQR